MKKLAKITQSQIAEKGVVSLSDRPNASAQYGVGGLSPQQLKLWFDKLATFLAEKINGIQDALSGDDAAQYIRVLLDEYHVESLDDLINSFDSGDFAAYILKVYPSANSEELVPLQTLIASLAKQIKENEGKVADGAITTEKIKDSSVTSEKLSDNIELKGIPTTPTPEFSASNNQIANVDFVKAVSDEMKERLEEKIVNKLDAVSIETLRDKAYVKTASGDTQTMFDVSKDVVPNSIVRRDPEGNINLCNDTSTFDDNQAVSKKYVLEKIAELVDGSPELLNSFNEFAKALGNDPNFASTITELLAKKLNAVKSSTSTAQLYGKTASGAQTMYGVSPGVSGYFVPTRDAKGNLLVPSKEENLVDGGAVPKSYVDKKTGENSAAIAALKQYANGAGIIYDNWYRPSDGAQTIGKEEYGIFLIPNDSTVSYVSKEPSGTEQKSISKTADYHALIKMRWRDGSVNVMWHVALTKGVLTPSYSNTQSYPITDITVLNTQTEVGMNIIRMPMNSPKS